MHGPPERLSPLLATSPADRRRAHTVLPPEMPSGQTAMPCANVDSPRHVAVLVGHRCLVSSARETSCCRRHLLWVGAFKVSRRMASTSRSRRRSARCSWRRMGSSTCYAPICLAWLDAARWFASASRSASGRVPAVIFSRSSARPLACSILWATAPNRVVVSCHGGPWRQECAHSRAHFPPAGTACPQSRPAP